jgi:hypothetical protein
MALELTDEQMIEEIASRMGEFRAGMGDLVQRLNIHPDVQMNEQTKQVGIILIDRKYNRPDLMDQAYKVAMAREKDLSDATPLPDPSPEELAEIEKLMEGEGDPIGEAPK